MTGHWKCGTIKLDPKNAVGFVYLIIEKETNRIYIGKKNFTGRGKLNKGEPSNWKTYTSSSNYLKELMSIKGTEAFDFFILEQYYTVGGLSWAETWTQTVCEVPSNNSRFFNRFIDKVSWKVTEPVTERHRRRLKKLLKDYPLKEFKNG